MSELTEESIVQGFFWYESYAVQCIAEVISSLVERFISPLLPVTNSRRRGTKSVQFIHPSTTS